MSKLINSRSRSDIFFTIPESHKEQDEILAIDYHQDKYNEAKAKIDKQKQNIEKILEIQDELNRRYIMGYKYNHQLEEAMQSFTCYHMYLEFDKPCNYMYVINR